MSGGRRRVLALLGVMAAVLVGAPASVADAAPSSGSPQWWMNTWHLQQVWNGGARGQGVTIAEIDTGVSGDIPELSSHLLAGINLGPAGGDGRTDHEVDPFGHGTAMASIMIAQPGPYPILGVAPDARVLPIAVPISGTDDASDGGDMVPQAIRYAADHGGKIISMSLGGTRDPDTESVPCPQDEQSAITYAISKGLIVVAASGNSGTQGSPVEDPGVCLGVVSVGAVDINNQVADFSSRHPYLTVSAPGVNIPSLGRIPGDAYAGDGTSQATAMTSATLALIWSKYPKLTGDQVVARLLATLDRRSATRDPAYGFGIINAQTAVTASVPATAPNPVYQALSPFLARQKAAAAPAPVVSKVPAATDIPGEFAIGKQPSLFTGKVLLGAVIGGLGVIALLLLLIVGLIRRRKFAPVPQWRPAVHDQHWVGPAQVGHEQGGVVWHDVAGPPQPYQPPSQS